MNHPQIAIFARSAKEDTPYLRSIEGQKSLLGRTMHDIAFDAIHDELVVTSPLAQAILSFRGAANGEEAPLRAIQGDKTQIKGVGATGKVSIDPIHNEIFLASPDQAILVFDRMANGNVAPKRILSGPDTQLSLGEQREGAQPADVPLGTRWQVRSGIGSGGHRALVSCAHLLRGVREYFSKVQNNALIERWVAIWEPLSALKERVSRSPQPGCGGRLTPSRSRQLPSATRSVSRSRRSATSAPAWRRSSQAPG